MINSSHFIRDRLSVFARYRKVLQRSCVEIDILDADKCAKLCSLSWSASIVDSKLIVQSSK